MQLTGLAGAALAGALLAGCAPEAATRPAEQPQAGGGWEAPHRGGLWNGAMSGTMAPDFSAADVEGATFRLSDHLGKEVVLLDFWSTYCEPCKAEFPHLRAMFERQRAAGLLVVGVAMDGPETSADVPAFVKRFGVSFPVVVDEDSRIASLYNPKKSMPLNVLIDRAGKIAVVREGYNPGDERLLAADVTTVLGQRGTAQ